MPSLGVPLILLAATASPDVPDDTRTPRLLTADDVKDFALRAPRLRPAPCRVLGSEASDAEVYDLVFRRSRPAVVKAGAQQIVHALGDHFGGSFASLIRAKYASLEVSVDVDKAGKNFNRFNTAKGCMSFPEVRDMTFGDFVEAVGKGSSGFALQQVEFDFAHDLGFELPTAVHWAEPVSNEHYTWLAGLNKTSHAHYDNDDGMLVQLTGSKRVLLVDPGHFAAMRPTLAPHEFKRSAADSGIGAEGAAGLSALPSWHFSGTARFPFEFATECHVGPGDLLFIPAFWWHRVENYAVHAQDGLNAAFNWWFFTDRLLRDQLWPFVQRNLFHVSQLWRLLPSSDLFTAAEEMRSAKLPSEKFWWPAVPFPSCANVAWGSFPPVQLLGRFLSRSRPTILRGVTDPVKIPARTWETWMRTRALVRLGNGSTLHSQVQEVFPPAGYTGAVIMDSDGLPIEALLEVDGDTVRPTLADFWPLGEEALAPLVGESKDPGRPQVHLARGNLKEVRVLEENHFVHWQLQGTAFIDLDAPLSGLRRRMDSEGGEAGPPMASCQANAGDVVLLPSHWWHSIAADEHVSIALQWRLRPHELASRWWQALTAVLHESPRLPPEQGSWTTSSASRPPAESFNRFEI